MITVTKAQAAAITLAKLAEGTLSGGAYYRAGEHDAQLGRSAGRPECKVGNRCAIGWLLPEAMAYRLEQAAEGYVMVATLIYQEELVVDDGPWFIELQRRADLALNGNFEGVIRHCRAALRTMGYDIGNRRSGPVYQ